MLSAEFYAHPLAYLSPLHETRRQRDSSAYVSWIANTEAS